MKISILSFLRPAKLMVVASLAVVLFSACTKEDDDNDDDDNNNPCPISGLYKGVSTRTSNGSSSDAIYSFNENNFTIGYHVEGGDGKAFGGYRNTCDSIFFNVYYTQNSNYYFLRGKFTNNRNTITGVFQNLTVPADFGTFTMSK